MLTHNTVLFDLDGTLINPLADSSAAVNHMCRSFGLPERTPEQVAAGMGRGIRNLVIASLPENCGVSVEEAEKAYRDYYAEHFLDSSRAYDGVIELLCELKNAGAKTAVISNKAHEFTEKLTETLFSGYIDVCIGETPGIPLKPDPAPVKKALEQLSSTPEDAVYVGDTEIDMETAKNSNLHCITCAWGLRGRQSLLDNGANPEFLANSPMDVLKILSRK